MTFHTKAPWEVSDDYTNPNEAVIKLGAAYVACGGSRSRREANARRIVACINRLAPFSTEQIEDNSCDLFEDRRIVELEQQRDELLAALIAIRDGKDNPCHIVAEALEKAGAA